MMSWFRKPSPPPPRPPLTISVEGEMLDEASFEAKVGFHYRPTMMFDSSWVYRRIAHRTDRLRKRGDLTIEQQWLGTLYRDEIVHGKVPPVEVRWAGDWIGWGLFAKESLPSMSCIGIYAGLVRKRTRSDVHNPYCFAYQIVLDEETPYIIDAREQGSLVRLMNHSETPNCTPCLASVGEITYILLLSKGPIAKGAQLTYHYGHEYWAKRPSPVLIDSALPSSNPQ